MTTTTATTNESWPELALDAWRDTKDTLHMWTQIVGKVRLAHTPLVNHYWNVPLYVTARGLSTSLVERAPRAFEVEFDFLEHALSIRREDGAAERMKLYARSVADFHEEFVARLKSLEIDAPIWTMPVEVEDPIRFELDAAHASYDPEYANRFHRILVHADRAMKRFRSEFVGKVSPVHFFWGSFDLAVTRFSGRRAPARPEADRVTREAYSHEVISHGFWPGGGDVTGPAFYSYTAPAPEGIERAALRPETAYWNPGTAGFILLYDDVRRSADPEAAIAEFFRSTYEAGADLAKWDREALERR